MTRHPHVLALAAVLLASCGGGGRSAETRLPERDRTWLEGAHESGLAEIRLGGLAVKKGGSRAIRTAGRKLVADHTRLDTDVARLADRLGVDVRRTAGRLDIARRLADEAGGRFDRDFVAEAITGHHKAITDAEAEARGGLSPAVTGLARGALPRLREHLAMLRNASPVS